MSRSSAAAAVATRASSSAVAPPAETPSTVALVRAVGGTWGSRPSITATTTVKAARTWSA